MKYQAKVGLALLVLCGLLPAERCRVGLQMFGLQWFNNTLFNLTRLSAVVLAQMAGSSSSQ
jgi:hypothetical protein